MNRNKKLAEMTRAEVLRHPAYMRRMDLCIDGAIRKVKHGVPNVTRADCSTLENSEAIEVVEVFCNTKLFCTFKSYLRDGKFVIDFTSARSITQSEKINSN
jgi:hypothetical protein